MFVTSVLTVEIIVYFPCEIYFRKVIVVKRRVVAITDNVKGKYFGSNLFKKKKQKLSIVTKTYLNHLCENGPLVKLELDLS